MENPIKMDDLGVPLFLETPIYVWLQVCDISQRPFLGMFFRATVPGGHIMILGGCTGDGKYYLHATGSNEFKGELGGGFNLTMVSKSPKWGLFPLQMA